MTVEVYVRDATRATIGIATRWQRLTVVERLADMGRWTISLTDAGDWAQFDHDMSQGWLRGVVVVRGGQVLTSGWADHVAAGLDEGTGRPFWLVSGWNDMLYLARHLNWPAPASGITQQTVSHDVRTGPAETRFKAYAAANLVSRLALSGVTIPASGGAGGSATSRERFSTLLDLAQRIRLGGGSTLVPTCKQNLSRQIVLDMRARQDLRFASPNPVQFSPDVGTVVAWSYERTAPEYTRVVVGAGGELENRGLRLKTAEPATRPIRPELFRDARDIDITEAGWETEADERGAETLAEHGQRSSFQIKVNESEGLRYGTNFQVGDLVRAYLTDTHYVDDVVYEAELTWTGADFGTAVVHVGPTTDPDDPAQLALQEQRSRRRISALERAI